MMMTVKPQRKSVSESLEDYLEVIWFLSQQQATVHNKDIARELGVKMPSVTAALQHLKELGYIEYDRKTGPRLTDFGSCLAKQVAERHTLLKDFFSTILLMPNEAAESIACSLEHVISQDATHRLEQLMDYLKQNCFQCKAFRYDEYKKNIDQNSSPSEQACSEE